ncbi:Co-chaperone Hsc20 [Irpex rosettiformis]|uniref:Co-chaperone Hsc20 n=1 Tax=Irpex rosettiformis TaxID=378272 RepID=A0ACB8UKQ2_9APHY|nr:Co-chaperone Hsc20 [Irpex rosettiformis]
MFRSTVTTATRRVCLTSFVRGTAITKPIRSYSLLPRTPSTLHRRTTPTFVWRRYESSGANPSAKSCPSCGAPLPTNLPACPSCFEIQPLPQDASLYEIMEIPEDVRFDVDEDLLKRNFRQIQRVIHPDKWSSKGPGAYELAAEMSSRVNKAYKTLLNPYTRAEYLLQKEGLEISESDGVQDPELITEILELRMAVEEAESQEDVDEIRAENADNIKVVIDNISTYVEGGNWEAVKRETIKLKYMQGIDAAAEAWPNTANNH